jgi:hypothetical protein
MADRSAEEELFDARDSSSSAIVLGLLVFFLTGIHLLVSRAVTPRALINVRIVLCAVSAGGVLYLLATRKRPNAKVALAFSGLLIATLLVATPIAAVAWQRAGRPWEFHVLAQFVLLSAAAASPRPYRLALAILLVLLGTALVLHFWFVHAGTPPDRLPIGEPYMILSFATISFAVLHLRRRRRELGLQFLRRSAEALTLQRLAALLGGIAREVSSAAGALTEATRRLRGSSDNAVLAPVERAVERVVSVRDGLDKAISRGRATVADDEERAFHARDAHTAVMILATTAAVLCAVVSLATHNLDVGKLPLFLIGTGSLSAAAAASLYLTRRQPSERYALALFLVVVLPLFAQFAYATPGWAASGRPFEPLPGNKMFLLILPLIVPRRPWLAVSLELLMALFSIALYFHFGLDHTRDRSPYAEPWLTVSYLLVGLALVAGRENRRVMSLRLLRADREVATLLSSAGLSLTLLDQLGSPLQLLTVSVELLRAARVDANTLASFEEALGRLVAATHRVPPADAEAYRYIGESFKGLRA